MQSETAGGSYSRTMSTQGTLLECFALCSEICLWSIWSLVAVAFPAGNDTEFVWKCEQDNVWKSQGKLLWAACLWLTLASTAEYLLILREGDLGVCFNCSMEVVLNALHWKWFVSVGATESLGSESEWFWCRRGKDPPPQWKTTKCSRRYDTGSVWAESAGESCSGGQQHRGSVYGHRRNQLVS